MNYEFIRHFKALFHLLLSEIAQKSPKNCLREVRTPYCTQINNTCVAFICTLTLSAPTADQRQTSPSIYGQLCVVRYGEFGR